MSKEIYLAGGCFWGVEKYFQCVDGVLHIQAGYANGKTENPSYEQVCYNHTGHAEAVRIKYDNGKLDLAFLLELYFAMINPLTVNRQGNDIGPQYRTGIYYTDFRDQSIIVCSLAKLQTSYKKKLAIETGPLQNFYPAETYHQNYLNKHPNGYCHISQKQLAQAKQSKPPAPTAVYHRQSPKQLAQRLTPLQYQVTQQNATEPPFHNPYFDEFSPSIYVDITTGQPLFLSNHKYDAGCGWPSFTQPLHPALLQEHTDISHDMHRTEVRSLLGNAHLGHVFSDGPSHADGRRYCINSAALRFIPQTKMATEGYSDLLPLLSGCQSTHKK